MKYNWPIVGHKNVVEYLQLCLKNNRLNHAYLFSGPSNIGKTTVAEYFVKSLLCLDEEIIPCNKCSMCQQFEKGIHPDVIYIERKKEKKDITIEQIRELQHFISLSAFSSSKYKVAIIREAEFLNREATNCLLKTLEEPSKNSILILITSQADRLLETIISRCQRINFLLLGHEEITEFLDEQYNLSKTETNNLVHLCGGRPGLAINFLKSPKEFENYKINVENFINFLDFSLIDKFKFINQIVFKKDFIESQKIFKQTLTLWLSVVRDLILLKIGLNMWIYNFFIISKLEQIANQYSIIKLTQILDKINQAKIYLGRNANPKLVMEDLVLNFYH